MTMATKKEYINTVRFRYKKCRTRHDKSSIISELQANLRKCRKHIIKILNLKFYKPKRKLPTRRPEVYTFDLRVPLETIWEVAGKPCSKNLRPQIPELLKKLIQFNEISVDVTQGKLLCKMSTGIIDKLLRTRRQKEKGRGISGTKRSPLLKTLIPIRTNFDDVNEPGHLEEDCVLHCGTSNTGEFGETLNSLDIDTYWSEQTAFLHKTNVKVIGAFHTQRKRFPFQIKSADFDNGYEFINWNFHKYCKKEGIAFTRSRPYRKNDQAHIEGKNYDTIRKVIGYDRIDKQEAIDLLNDIYANEFRLLNNFFYTNRKLMSKERVKGKVIKKYGKAMTPYARVLKSKNVDLQTKMKLIRQYNQLNPAELQRNLVIKLKALHEINSVSNLNWATTPTKS